MTIQALDNLLESALKEGECRPTAMDKTNILNAEYALGKYFGILNILKEEHGVEVMTDIHDKYRTIVDNLTERVNKIYERS